MAESRRYPHTHTPSFLRCVLMILLREKGDTGEDRLPPVSLTPKPGSCFEGVVLCRGRTEGSRIPTNCVRKLNTHTHPHHTFLLAYFRTSSSSISPLNTTSLHTLCLHLHFLLQLAHLLLPPSTHTPSPSPTPVLKGDEGVYCQDHKYPL